MPEYAFEYEETESYEVRFEADTKWEAQDIMDMVQNGEIDPKNWKHANSWSSIFKLTVDKTSLTRTDGEEL
jgi:hypothetical protein